MRKKKKAIKKNWQIKIGKGPEHTIVSYGRNKLGYIQSLDLHIDASNPFPELKLVIADPRLKIIKGFQADANIQTGTVCLKCGEEERISNKSW